MALVWRSGLALLLIAAAAVAAAPAHAATLPSGFVERDLATGLGTLSPDSDKIVDVAWAPDGRMFMADRAGLVYVHNPGDAPDVNHVVLDIADHVNSAFGSDHGLLGIATDRDFASNGRLYLLYTYDTNTADNTDPKVSVLTRVSVNPDNSVAGGTNTPHEDVMLGSERAPENDATNGACGPPAGDNDCIPSEGLSHSIGTVRVAPDGTLFVGTGDGTDYLRTDPLGRFDDDPETFRGKIMHIQPNGQGVPGHPFCPSDSNLDDVCTKIFAGGLRNPYRFNLMPGGGLVIGDVGQNTFEEIDLAHGGENFGWPCYEGFDEDTFDNADGTAYSGQGFCQAMYSAGAASQPAFAYPHLNQPSCDPSAPTGDAIIGGPVYEGDQYPAGYRGQVFFGNLQLYPGCGWMGRMNLSGDSLTGYQVFATNWGLAVDLESAPDGNLVYVSFGDNAVREIVYGPGNHRPSVAPSAAALSGAPLTVALSAHASDPDGDPLSYDWGFGDGSPHSTSPNPTHVYTTRERRVATVTVDDGRGMTASGSVSIPLSGPPLKIGRLRVPARMPRGTLKGSFTAKTTVKTFNVALWRGSCHWWSRRSHKLRGGACGQPHWMRAALHRKGTRYAFTLKLGGMPPRGRYTVVVRAIPRTSAYIPSAKMRRTLRLR